MGESQARSLELTFARNLISAIVGKKIRAKLHCRSFLIEVLVWTCEETSVPQNVVVLAFHCFMLKVEAAEV